MCGLVGFVSANGTAAQWQATVAAATTTLAHRGPDEAALRITGDDCLLAFQRLSIIDVAGSHQPLSYGDGRYTLVFNGEIYNYLELRDELVRAGARLDTAGDTEVVAAAYDRWGPGALHRLRGMYAFALWDARERRLVAARDPFGIKPLYYAATAYGLWLASEKKALLSVVDGAVDPVGLGGYLALQYVPEPGSLHTGIARLGSGALLTYTPGGVPVVERYWRPEFRPTPAKRQAGGAEGLHRRILDALRDSVRIHLRSDVPVGAFLSSGVDSTAIVALAREVKPDLRTFTAALAAPGYSELDVAQRSAEALGVATYPVAVDARMMMDALPRIVWHLDDPVADPSLVPLYYLARRAAQDVTVVLSGEGADELFGGYPLYREPLSLRPYTRLPVGLRRGLARLARVLPEGVRGRGVLERGARPVEERYDGGARLFTRAQLARLSRVAPVSTVDQVAPWYAECAGLDDVTRMQYVDLYTWLRGDILHKADRMSMAHSLELRVPFLDPEVFAVAATVPVEEKVPPGTTKYALRRALATVVPPSIVERSKLGFPTPIRVWLCDEMYPWARDILAGSGAGEWVDLAYARRLLDAHRRGHGDQSRRVWAVLVFCLWHAIFVERSLDPLATAGTPRPGRSTALRPHPG